MIVVFPIIPWGFLWQRPQQLLSRLAKEGQTVIYLAQTSDPAFAPQGELSPLKTLDSMHMVSENLVHFWCYTEEACDIHHDPITPKMIKNILDSVLPVLEQEDPEPLYYLVQHPAWTRLALEMQSAKKGFLIYDCMDEHSGFSNVLPESLVDEDQLLKSADLVLTTSLSLHKKASALNERVVLLRNGTDFSAFHGAFPNDELAKLSEDAIVGYYGSICEWFDFDLLEHSAKARTNCQFVIIGNHSSVDVSRFESTENVHFLDAVPYKDLPGYLAHFNVCIIPFKLCPLTLATNPVKFYEYLSCGKPVVSSKLPELFEHSDICYLADTKEDFISCIDQALREPSNNRTDDLYKRRMKVAHQNSWDKRAESFRNSLAALAQHSTPRCQSANESSLTARMIKKGRKLLRQFHRSNS